LIFVAVVRPSRPRPSEPVARANPRVPQKMAPRTEGLVAGPSLCVGWVHPPRTHECFRLIRAVSRPRQKEPRQQGRRGQVCCGVRVHPPPLLQLSASLGMEVPSFGGSMGKGLTHVTLTPLRPASVRRYSPTMTAPTSAVYFFLSSSLGCTCCCCCCWACSTVAGRS
jgi:hypothetical protein